MALPILDGNQTATTLSTIVAGGQHIPAHTVVSLGSQAISDISNAVSSVQVSGTVTANVPYQDINAGIADWVVSTNDPIPVAPFGDTLPISGTVTANVGGIASGVTLPVRLFAEAEGGPSSGQDTLVLCDSGGQLLVNAKSGGVSVLGYDGNAFVQVKQVAGSSVTIGSLPAISGTVTAKLDNDNFSGALTNYIDTSSSHNAFPVEIAYQPSVTIGSLPAISGTVTANNPSGALTTRFGSVTTANTAQITSAVTNTSRKYLLAQNISAGTVTIGIGFSPTTTQGIQLTAGGGLTFDAFCPTGAVYWLGAVTGAAYTILEG